MTSEIFIKKDAVLCGVTISNAVIVLDSDLPKNSVSTCEQLLRDTCALAEDVKIVNSEFTTVIWQAQRAAAQKG